MELNVLINSISSVFASLLGWIPDVLEVALESPIVIIFIALAVCGVIVGFAKKLLHF